MDKHHSTTSHDQPVDPDLVLLESYLDGELSSGEVQSLQQRLHADAELSAALARLSEDFVVRQEVWTSLEGTQVEGQALSRQVVRSIRRAGFWERSRNYVRAGVAVAACLVCFAAGWMGRGSTATAATADDAASGDSASSLVATSATPVDVPLVYQVALTDEQGNITAIQKFDNLDDARSFAADLGKWQAEQAQLQYGQPVLTQSGL